MQPGRLVPLRRLERRHLPPEGSALSTELQGRDGQIVTYEFLNFKLWRYEFIPSSSSPRQTPLGCTRDRQDRHGERGISSRASSWNEVSTVETPRNAVARSDASLVNVIPSE